jgi:Fe-S cluster assembly iron-binding protein IscA
MKKTILSLFLLSLYFTNLNAQINKGINFQGVARNSNGIILANKIIGLRLSIKNDSLNGVIEYQEIKSITTNAIGLFSVVVGSKQDRNIISIGNFENINWSNTEKYLQVEVDVTGELYFSSIGIQKINYVPYAFYADKVDAVNINGIIGVKKGGTGFDNIKDFKIMAAIDKVNNTPDSLKPSSLYTIIALNEKLKKSDTAWLSNRIDSKLNKTDTNHLSNRINQKLNISDTIKIYNKINQIPLIDTTSLGQRINFKLNKSDTNHLSNRINQKLNLSDTIKIYSKISAIPSIDTTSLSNRIDNKISIGSLTKTAVTNALNYTPVANDFGSFYDTAKQITPIATASVVKFNFMNFANNITITNNSSGLPTRITVNNGGLYNVKYTLQFIKTDGANDEVSVWIRRNSSAYANTNNTYTITGLGIKNMISNSFFIELGDNDYVEIYFSLKNINTSLVSSNPQLTPSRPATPAAMVSMQRINCSNS